MITWSDGNINAQRYNFKSFVTALFESIHVKAKAKLMRGESTGPLGQSSVLVKTHIGEYSRNLRHLRREKQYKTKNGNHQTFKEAH